MASQLFTEAPAHLTMEDLRKAIAEAGKRLDEKRAAQGITGFARVYVTQVLVHPRSGAVSCTVSYSDTDEEMPKRIFKILHPNAREEVTQHFYDNRDPYCA